MLKNKIKIKPSILVKPLWIDPFGPSIKKSLTKIPTANIASKEKGISLLTVALLTIKGHIIAAMPRINKVLEILEPIMLPKAMPVLPFTLAKALITNSGAEVPKATIVKPIKKLETPYLLAIDEEPSIIMSAPLIRNMKPRMNRIIVRNINL